MSKTPQVPGAPLGWRKVLGRDPTTADQAALDAARAALDEKGKAADVVDAALTVMASKLARGESVRSPGGLAVSLASDPEKIRAEAGRLQADRPAEGRSVYQREREKCWRTREDVARMMGARSSGPDAASAAQAVEEFMRDMGLPVGAEEAPALAPELDPARVAEAERRAQERFGWPDTRGSDTS